MSNEIRNIDTSGVDKQSQKFFKDGDFSWSKAQGDVWSNIEAKMDAKPKGRSLPLKTRTIRLAVAATIIVLIGASFFFRYYAVTVIVPTGEHQLATLPDGSTIDLNAESSLKYKPLWWRFNREIQFEGEGFFEVEKGKNFKVVSNAGITEVLGTSFNIFSRDEVYKVTCLTGSVKVTSPALKSVILKPNSKAEIKTNGSIEVKTDIDVEPVISWKKNLFIFTASPLREVFYEIERQYGVTISTKIDSYALYSGNFSKDSDVEDILSYVCPALGLEFFRKSDGEFIITEESE